jgi:LPXTG-site transpeptidase (sortase) family protein
MNPLFPDEPDQPAHTTHHPGGYVLPRQELRLDPLPPEGQTKGAQAATDLIRSKIDALYHDGPAAKQELREATTSAPPRSKHQQYMYSLSTSGKSLAEIQTAWHAYYAGLSDHDKRAVWQEFYASTGGQHTAMARYATPHTAGPSSTVIRPDTGAHRHPAGRTIAQPNQPAVLPSSHHGVVVVAQHEPEPAHPNRDGRSFATVKKHVLKTVRNRHAAEIKAKQHLQSLAFGLGIGALVLVVTLFGLFNEVAIAPFIHPNSRAQATPIILSTDGVAPTDKPEVIIPKINVELPYILGSSVVEADIEQQLEDGIAHYPTTAQPGQLGNAAFFGHSSNNIFNKGRYKFAFVLLHELQPGDIFYLTNGGKVYTYKVFQKKVVEPTETWVLNPVQGKAATATLITCDPPGTSLHRLVVWGEQVNPDPLGNTAAPAQATPASSQAKELPSNSPTLWSRFYHWATPW